MECRQLYVNVMSAADLKAVDRFSKEPEVYVGVSLDDPATTCRTRAVSGGKNHRWDDGFSFSIDATALNYRKLLFIFKSKSVFGAVRVVGRLVVPLKVLFDDADADAAADRVVEYPVHRLSGEPGGTLRFSYKFWDRIAVPVKTAGALAADKANVGSVTGNPLAPGYCHGDPPQPVYGHAPATYGYAPPVVQGYCHGDPPQPAYGRAPATYGYVPPVVQAPPPVGQAPAYGYGNPPQPAYGHAPAMYPYVPPQPPKPRRKWKRAVLKLVVQLGMRCLVDYIISDASEMAESDAGLGDADVDF